MAELSIERRERILQAMAQSVVEEGIQGASLRKVARRAHATTGMITHYYRSKNELIVDALRHAAGRYRNTLAFAGKPGLDRLKRRLEARFKNQSKEDVPSWKYFIEYWAASTRSEELRKHHVDLCRAGTASMTEDIKAAIDQGEAKPEVDAETAADITHALYYGLGVLSTLDPEAYSEERSIAVYRAALDSLLKTRRD
jgi:AcrR family transcriptional regulator